MVPTPTTEELPGCQEGHTPLSTTPTPINQHSITDAGSTPTTPTINTNTDTKAPLATASLHPRSQLESVDLRTQLLSPVGDLIDSPVVPPAATKMSPVPLPDMDDHDDPTASLPRSLEQMDIREAQEALKRSPQEKARMRRLTVAAAHGTLGGGGGVIGQRVSPPPSSPLAGLPPSTAPPHLTSFQGFGTPHSLDSSTSSSLSSLSRSGSIPSTPNAGALPVASSYTQSQPLPQLPMFAPALSVINEGGAIAKDDLHLNMIGGGRLEGMGEYEMYGENDGMNRAIESTQQQQQQQKHRQNVTITPVYQQFGTITVSNSVVTFPNQSSASANASNNNSSPGSTTAVSTAQASASGGASSRSSSTGMTEQTDLGLHGKTPNVYINGLPPHFPEEQLQAMAEPFGVVKSVRTFTRHVRDSESGYGFVL